MSAREFIAQEEAKKQIDSKEIKMPYKKVKVYSDGSHYIGIPHTTNAAAAKRRQVPEEEISVLEESKGENVANEVACEDAETLSQNSKRQEPRRMTRKGVFEELYAATAKMRAEDRRRHIVREMRRHFKTENECEEYVGRNLERKKRNMICRKVRLWRKINQQPFNFFVTFTYSDALHTEESFCKTLKTCLQHFSSRKGWRYIGVWERSPEKKRLHFHGIFHIPDGALPGNNVEVRDYDTRAKEMRITLQNDFFGKKFGRNDFKPVQAEDLPHAVKYLTKYIEKTGEKLVYSRGLYQYFVTDVMDDDIICLYGLEDRKFILADDFGCWMDGEYMGQVAPEVIAQLPKSNR